MNDGGTVAANTYINLTTGGGLPNGEVQVSDEHWGVMRVDLSSCLEGTLTYRSCTGHGPAELIRAGHFLSGC